MLENLSVIETTNWDEIFKKWKEREMNPICKDDWIKCATEVKGWKDWHSWRSYSALAFNAQDRKWTKDKI